MLPLPWFGVPGRVNCPARATSPSHRFVMSAVLEVQNLCVSLSGQSVLEDIDMDVERGAWIGLIGPNGSGKTTLLRALTGLIPYTGRISLLGRPLRAWSLRERARRMALVRQVRPPAFDFTVGELVLLGRTPHKGLIATWDLADRKLMQDALELVDLGGFEDRDLGTLSGGEQQRCFLAQALVQQADILLLDEPTTYLDVHHQFGFMEHVSKLRDRGITVIGAVHDLELAARFSSRLLMLERGRVAVFDAPERALTPERLRRVFRMDAHAWADSQGRLRLQYEGPI